MKSTAMDMKYMAIVLYRLSRTIVGASWHTSDNSALGGE